MAQAAERNTWTSSRTPRPVAPPDGAPTKDERDLAVRRELNNGFGDALTRAMSWALVPPLFGFGGWLVDQRMGWTPALTIAAVVYGVVGLLVREWYAYDARMRDEGVRLFSRQAPEKTHNSGGAV